MALQKQKVQLSIVAGIDTKTDEKNVPGTSFLELENLNFTKTGSLVKRYGYEQVSTSILGGGSLSSGNAITTFKDELLQYSKNRLYSYSEAEVSWLDKGAVTVATNEQYPIISDNKDLVNSNYATTSGVSAYAANSFGGATSSVAVLVDNTTNTVLAKHTLSTTGLVRVEAVLNRFFFMYIDAGSLKFQYVDAANPTVISSATTISTITSLTFASVVVGQKVFLTWGTLNAINVAFIELPNVVSGVVSISGPAFTDVISISKENISNVRIGFGNSGVNGYKTALFNYSLSAQLHPTTTVFAAAAPQAASSVQTPNILTQSTLIVSVLDTGNIITKSVTVDQSGTAGAEVSIFYKNFIQSNAVVYNDTIYFVAIKVDALPLTKSVGLTYYLMSSDSKIVSRFEIQNGILKPYSGTLIIEDDTLCFVGESLTEFQESATSVTGPTAIKKYCANFNSVKNYFDAETANNLYVSGGVVKSYDGDRLVEQGFLETPSAIVSTSVSATGGPAGVGSSAGSFPTTVQYCYVMAWRDRFGQIHRSAPSPVTTVSIANGTSKVLLTFYPYTFSEKTNIEIELYRTEGAGTVFYKASGTTFSNRIINSETSATQTFEDSLSDADLIKGETLYTTGGILENDAAPPSSFLVTFKNRLFAISSDGRELQYSKLVEINSPVEFNAALKIKLDSRGGKATTLAVLDDYLIVFKERAIFAMSGEGPNNLGEQDDYRQPQLLTSDAGCIEPNSVCNSSEGVFFKSEKGIYILRRGLAVEYIGAPVEAYNSLEITSGTLLADSNQIRFTTESGRALVYDYFHRMWSTYTNVAAVDATLYQNTYVFVKGTGSVLKETVGLYKDIASYIKIKIVSSWIQLAGIQGFERFYKMLILGTYKTAHKLTVSFAYNFNPTYKQDAEIDTADTINPTAYGTGIYGSEAVYGGSFPLYQFEIRPKIQKCQAFKFKIEDSKTTVDGEGFAISNFAAIIGIKEGLTTKSAATKHAAK